MRARTRYGSGELTERIVNGLSMGYDCWAHGQVLFDEGGFAVVVGKSPTEWIPVAIVTPHPQLNKPGSGSLLLLSAFEGSVWVTELESVTMRLIKIAARLVELRAGGWDIQSKQRPSANGNLWRWGSYNKQLSKFIFSVNIIDPLTEQLAYRFPDLLPKRKKRQAQVLRQLLRELGDLPDSPLLLLDSSANNSRLLALEEWSGELKGDSYERLALARYPQLPIEDVIAIAEKARQNPRLDPLAAIEAAKI